MNGAMLNKRQLKALAEELDKKPEAVAHISNETSGVCWVDVYRSEDDEVIDQFSLGFDGSITR